MAVYIFVPIVTALLAWASDKTNSRVFRYFLLGIIIFIFCYFASMRAMSVGSDTSYYGYPTYQGAIKYPFLTYISPQVYSSWGFLYKVLAWVSSNIFGSFQSLLFVIELCTVAPVVFAGRKLAGKSFPLLIGLFAIYFYPLSFNLMRQCIAMSFLLPAYCALEKKNTWLFLAWVLVAYLFHSSGIIGLLLFPLYAITKPGKMSFTSKAVLVLMFSLAGIIAVPYILNLVAHLLPHYSAYLDGGSRLVSGHGYRNTIEMGFGFLAVFMLAQLLKSRKRIEPESIVYRRFASVSLIVVFGVVVTGLSPYSVALGRAGLYFFFFFILLGPTCKDLILRDKERQFFSIFCVVIMILIALDTFVITGQNNVVPYLFSV